MKNFQYALHGLLAALRSEKNLRFHVISAVLVTVAGIFFKIQLFEWLMIIFCIALVISMELMNTALEALCNAFTKDQHPAIKLVKDIAAAAVLVAAVGFAVTGIIIFLPKLILYIN
jgi:diacylglycerol kinase